MLEKNPSMDRQEVYRRAESMAAPILNELFEKADQDRGQFDESRTGSSDDSMGKSSGDNLSGEQVESPRSNEDENKK